MSSSTLKLHRVCEMEALHPSFSKPAKPFPNTPASTSVLRDSETSRMGDSECIISYDYGDIYSGSRSCVGKCLCITRHQSCLDGRQRMEEKLHHSSAAHSSWEYDATCDHGKRHLFSIDVAREFSSDCLQYIQFGDKRQRTRAWTARKGDIASKITSIIGVS